MTAQNSRLADAARQLTDAVTRETRLAKSGSPSDLDAALSAKREAFNAFKRIRDEAVPTGSADEDDRQALEALLTATNENAIVLQGVKAALDNAVTRFQSALSSLSDPGIYGPLGTVARHLPAARFDAQA
jgi:hypothetical protein